MCVCVGLMVSLVSCLVIVRSLQLVSILCIVLAQVLMIFLTTPPRTFEPSSSTTSFVGFIGYLVHICYLVYTISAFLVYIRFLT